MYIEIKNLQKELEDVRFIQRLIRGALLGQYNFIGTVSQWQQILDEANVYEREVLDMINRLPIDNSSD